MDASVSHATLARAVRKAWINCADTCAHAARRMCPECDNGHIPDGYGGSTECQRCGELIREFRRLGKGGDPE